MVVDFDAKVHVNGFGDVPLHKYVVSGWRGVEGNPLECVPAEVQDIWATAPERPESG